MQSRLTMNDLLEYLQYLAAILRERGQMSLAGRVEFAAHFAIGSTTELCGESRDAFKHVLANSNGVLTQDELVGLRQKISEIDFEFMLIGGA